MDDLIGRTLLGRYRVDAFLGEGGMAEVYKAWDGRRSYHVAIKVVQEDLLREPRFLDGLRGEAELLRELRHPHIVRYYDFEDAGEMAFLVMEYVDGESLRSRLVALDKPLALGEVIGVLEPVCTALHYAHEEGVIHCDVKPANILIRTDGQVLLSDFGIARWSQMIAPSVLGIGAAAFMSPEQCTGAPLDRRTDVYALGLTAYEMLTLSRPFRGDSTTSPGTTADRIRWEHIHRAPPNPSALNREVAPEAERAILRALAKQPEDRQADVLTFLHDLSGHGSIQLQDTALWPPPGATKPPQKPSPARRPDRAPRPGKSPSEHRRPASGETIWQRMGFRPPSAHGTTRRAELHVIRGDSIGQSYQLGGEDVGIGRASDNQVRLLQHSVSRYHAIVRYWNGRFYVQDRGSLHGTYVNGRRVDAIALDDGDIIQIGETELLFHVVR